MDDHERLPTLLGFFRSHGSGAVRQRNRDITQNDRAGVLQAGDTDEARLIIAEAASAFFIGSPGMDRVMSKRARVYPAPSRAQVKLHSQISMNQSCSTM